MLPQTRLLTIIVELGHQHIRWQHNKYPSTLVAIALGLMTKFSSLRQPQFALSYIVQGSTKLAHITSTYIFFGHYQTPIMLQWCYLFKLFHMNGWILQHQHIRRCLFLFYRYSPKRKNATIFSSFKL